MFECNVRAANRLEKDELFSKLDETRSRLVGKIDIEKFNPFHSKDAQIVLIARAAAVNLGLRTNYDN
ncbi:hypothetical protein COU49_01105 [Candidatus Nomurabacteria bacterium CG10_big_fil_rev_8_21_14_0_10_35_16]|uniref:Uncharacterized protein n=1 Tax=Candidatus Nomurabacteria bacterium CG10_big_fil_rev_8_21_14_0_10_35_16 TaxID=1974731 RepID=A0A2H0TDS7_9BACT|nr:MAG: hypothetical protein COU49_01105 [Candidatus Nomurabacteria bacterium CG10_big_fil_rev_8_21_14_0_10_35_16]